MVKQSKAKQNSRVVVGVRKKGARFTCLFSETAREGGIRWLRQRFWLHRDFDLRERIGLFHKIEHPCRESIALLHRSHAPRGVLYMQFLENGGRVRGFPIIAHEGGVVVCV